MKIIEAGHIYDADVFDGQTKQIITFMKRVGSGYPGNRGEPHAGTNCQELIRILIDRVKYLDNQIPHEQNQRILRGLRRALAGFELRAAERHNRQLQHPLAPIEDIPSCKKCGHIQCEHLACR